MLGHSIIMAFKVNHVAKIRGIDKATHNFHLRVDQNEQTHSVLRSMKHHLATRGFKSNEYMPE